MRHALPVVALFAALMSFSACDDGECTDADGDGFGDGPGCEAADCDDSTALHHADCGACSDPDRDGRGVGCDLGGDCSPTNGLHWADCGKCMGDTDLDGFGKDCDLGPDCDENDPDQGDDCKACVDADGDGFFVGCAAFVNRPGPDCDDANPNTYLVCGFCADNDGDGHFAGCDVYGDTTPDCDDTDANNWDSCNVCQDRDGDGYFVGCDRFTGDIKGPDCNDGAANHHADCATCVDSDGDGRGTGCDLGADCSEANSDVFTSCGTCGDSDSDGYWAGCDTYFLHPKDCNDTSNRHWNDCATCVDADNDGYGTGSCNVAGSDCDDSNASRFPSNPDTTVNGTDENCDLLDGPNFRAGFENASYYPEFNTAAGDVSIYYTGTYAAHTGSWSFNLGGGGGSVTSGLFNTSACANGIAFKYWVKRGYPDAPEAVDNLVLEWSINGSTWTAADTYPGTGLADPAYLSRVGKITDVSAQTSLFRFRLRTTAGDGYGFDDFVIDDILLLCQQTDTDSDGVTDPIDCAPTNNKHWNDCGRCTDTDNDGYGTGAAGTCDIGVGDCSDTSAAINPAATDLTVDGTDQNCNGFDGTQTSSPSTSPAAAITDSGLDATGCGATGATSSAIVVSSTPGTLTDVDVSLNITHTADADLDIWLQYTPAAGSPVCVELSTDNGAAGANYTSTVLSDQGATSITAGTAPFTGTFSAEGLLSALNGKSPNGTWTLYVNDDTATNTGTLTSWSLTLTYY